MVSQIRKVIVSVFKYSWNQEAMEKKCQGLSANLESLPFSDGKNGPKTFLAFGGSPQVASVYVIVWYIALLSN